MIEAKVDDPRLPERFWSKVAPEPNTGCWLWTAATDRCGYGFYSRWSGNRQCGSARAHKVAYEVLIGPVPDGLVLDHLRCSTRCCVNPSHLNPTTVFGNIKRSPLYRGARTHCPAGHEYTPDNTRVSAYRGGTGSRFCRACDRATQTEIYYRDRPRLPADHACPYCTRMLVNAGNLGNHMRRCSLRPGTQIKDMDP